MRLYILFSPHLPAVALCPIPYKKIVLWTSRQTNFLAYYGGAGYINYRSLGKLARNALAHMADLL